MSKRLNTLPAAGLWMILLAFGVACGGDDEPGNGTAGAAGSSAGTGAGTGGSGGSPAAGAGGIVGGAGVGGGSAGLGGGSAGLGGGGASGGGSGGMSGASGASGGGQAGGGQAGAGQGGGGQGGASGSSGSAGAGGGKSAASAMIATTGASQISGTATFTQNGTSMTLVIQVSNCPAGNHATHIHQNKDCGDNGNAAGNHWMYGEGIPDINCGANGMGTVTHTPAAGTWTLNGDRNVTAHAIIVHAGPSPDATAGARIACGVINATP